MIRVFENCFQLRGRLVSNYVLLEPGRVILIDSGFLSNRPDRIASQLEEAGRSLFEVTHILVSHGHIDHTLNLAELKRRTNAQIWAPKLDALHISGEFPYRGTSRLCGISEAIARKLLRYEPPSIDRWLDDGEELALWDDLKTVALPGHTPGHLGFYSPSRQLLFANDLYSHYPRKPKLPPGFLNVDSREAERSVFKANRLALSGGVLLNHCQSGTPAEHRCALSKIADELIRKA